MRDIKFRAWDGMACYHFDLYEGLDEGFIMGTKDIFIRDCVVEQHVGLKDKNGKEIYEGDVVKSGGSILSIEFSGSAFWCMQGWRKPEERTMQCDILTDLVEVIGNIHENPELCE